MLETKEIDFDEIKKTFADHCFSCRNGYQECSTLCKAFAPDIDEISQGKTIHIDKAGLTTSELDALILKACTPQTQDIIQLTKDIIREVN